LGVSCELFAYLFRIIWQQNLFHDTNKTKLKTELKCGYYQDQAFYSCFTCFDQGRTTWPKAQTVGGHGQEDELPRLHFKVRDSPCDTSHPLPHKHLLLGYFSWHFKTRFANIISQISTHYGRRSTAPCLRPRPHPSMFTTTCRSTAPCLRPPCPHPLKFIANVQPLVSVCQMSMVNANETHF
jgi:hypothetical protein